MQRGRREGTWTSCNKTTGGDAFGEKLLNCLHCIHGAELHILHILSFVCIASDLRWSDGLPVTLNKREEGSIVRLLCNWVVCASIMG